MESCKLEGSAMNKEQLNGAFPEMFEQFSAQNDRLRNITNLLESKLITLLGHGNKEHKDKTETPKPNCWLYLMDNELRIARDILDELEALVERL